MDTALILEDAIHAIAFDADYHLFITADSTLGARSDGSVPALGLAEFEVHFCQIAGKESRLVATGAGTDFEDNILVVLRVGRDKEQLDILLDSLHGGSGIGECGTSRRVLLHRQHFVVKVDILRLGLVAVQQGFQAP